MKTIYSVVALCLVLSCAIFTEAVKSERSLKQTSVTAVSACRAVNGKCRSVAKVSTRAINDAASSIASALSTAVAKAQRREPATAAATAFAEAVATAYAKIISSHTLSVFATSGSTACAFTSSNARAFATAMAEATSRAFARSSNRYARAAAECFSDAVATASVTAVQKVRFGVCTNYGSALIRERIVTVGYAEAIATAFADVYTAVKNKDAEAASTCSSSAISNSGQFSFSNRG